MNKIITYPLGIDRFNPLSRILTYDVFDKGLNGWMALLPNFTQAPDFDVRESIFDKTQFPPVMLSSATYRYPGTHGAMSGTYSLKISTRPEANRYEEIPASGGLGHAVKRLSMPDAEKGPYQMEAWFSYTAEQDRISGNEDLAGISEKSIRAFGAGFDIQDANSRFFAGCRYLNSVNGELQQKWQVIQATESTNVEWAHGREGEWNHWGVDPMWYGRRYADGRHDGFKDVPDGKQKLCYNETDCKINWLYFRMLFDLGKHEYVELQAQDRIFDLRGTKFTLLKSYNRIDGLLNPFFWIENDTARRVFLYLDSVVISRE